VGCPMKDEVHSRGAGLHVMVCHYSHIESACAEL